MALADAVVGARHIAQQITWTDEDGTALDLTNATLTGRKRLKYEATGVAIDGTLTVTDSENGVFTWAYGAVDVGAAGNFKVQFIATYSSDDLDEKTLLMDWTVHEAIATA